MTPIASRATLSADAQPILIAALSGRALAAAARCAGARVIVLDLFADCDTAAYAERCLKLPPGPAGFDRAALLEAVAALAPSAGGLVYGAGFEHDPGLLAEIARLLPLLGNAAETVAAAKDPLGFAKLLGHLGLPHPETSRTPPSGGEGGWLSKRIGGSGGGHVAPVSGENPPWIQAGTCYYQREVRGRPVSALFVADGQAARVLGVSDQWVAATEEAPFRYGGCAGPVTLSPTLSAAIAAACSAIAAAAGLVGLNSLDLLVEGEAFHILEVNPRPGATLDLFDGRDGTSPWRLHLEGVAGRLPPIRPAAAVSARAAAVLYAPRAIVIPPDMIWPLWAADRGAPGTHIDRGAPVCTIRAAAPTAPAARETVERRAAALLARLTDGISAEP